MYKQLLLLFGLLSLSALFSGLETAFVAVSQIRARSFRDQKKKHGQLLYNLKQNQRRLIITVLIGNNLVNIGSSAYATLIFTQAFGNAGVGVATGVMTILILTFGEILPKTYFAKNADKIALRFARFMQVMQILLLPVVFVFEKISDAFKIEGDGKQIISENDIQAMVDVGTESEILHKTQRQLIHSVFEFDDTKVKEIITPRIDIFAVEENEKIRNIIRKVKKSGFARIPVYKDNIDKITGYFHIRDLLLISNKDATVREISHEIMFLSGEKIIQEAFAEFQKARKHIAVIVDEFGGTDGVVTMEDILEELVGEIHDEADAKAPDIKKINSTTYKVCGDTQIDDVNEKLDTNFPEDKEYNTMSGYIQYKLKDLPTQGQVITEKRRKLKIKITKMKDHKIEMVQISRL